MNNLIGQVMNNLIRQTVNNLTSKTDCLVLQSPYLFEVGQDFLNGRRVARKGSTFRLQ